MSPPEANEMDCMGWCAITCEAQAEKPKELSVGVRYKQIYENTHVEQPDRCRNQGENKG